MFVLQCPPYLGVCNWIRKAKSWHIIPLIGKWRIPHFFLLFFFFIKLNLGNTLPLANVFKDNNTFMLGLSGIDSHIQLVSSDHVTALREPLLVLLHPHIRPWSQAWRPVANPLETTEGCWPLPDCFTSGCWRLPLSLGEIGGKVVATTKMTLWFFWSLQDCCSSL